MGLKNMVLKKSQSQSQTNLGIGLKNIWSHYVYVSKIFGLKKNSWYWSQMKYLVSLVTQWRTLPWYPFKSKFIAIIVFLIQLRIK